jgi:hypothetical protein
MNSWLLLRHYCCNYGSRLVLHWHIKSEASVQMRNFMNYSAFWSSKEVLISTSDDTRLPFRQNRVAMVSSIITKIFNPSKRWTVTIQLLLNDTLFLSVLVIVCCQLLLFNPHSVILFNSVLLFKSISFVQYSNYSVNVQFWYWKCIPGISIRKHQTSAVNKHHTPDSTIFCLSIGVSGLLQS